MDGDKDFIASIPSRQYNISNEEDLNNAVKNMASDIEVNIQNKSFSISDLKMHTATNIISNTL